MSNGNIIGRRIREAREYCKLSTKDLAERITSNYEKISKQTISHYENGYVSPPPGRLVEISTILNFPIQYFTKAWASADEHTPAQFRKHSAATKKSRSEAELNAEWVLRIVSILQRYHEFKPAQIPQIGITPSIDDYPKIEDISVNIRNNWGLGNARIENLVQLLEEKGVIIVEIPIHGDLEAFSFWSNGRPFIFTNSDGEKGFYRTRFSIAHELGHLVMHKNIDPEILDNAESHKIVEKQAHKFAAAFLMPKSTFGQEITRFDEQYWLTLKQRWGVSFSAMMMRATDLGIFTEAQKTNYFKNHNIRQEPLDDETRREAVDLLPRVIQELDTSGKLKTSALLDEVGLNEEIVRKIFSSFIFKYS